MDQPRMTLLRHKAEVHPLHPNGDVRVVGPNPSVTNLRGIRYRPERNYRRRQERPPSHLRGVLRPLPYVDRRPVTVYVQTVTTTNSITTTFMTMTMAVQPRPNLSRIIQDRDFTYFPFSWVLKSIWGNFGLGLVPLVLVFDSFLLLHHETFVLT